MGANTLYQSLIQSGVVGSLGQTIFTLTDISTIVSEVSVIGYVIQDWLKDYMRQNNIHYRSSSNSQDFPDFYMHLTEDTTDLLEVKCFTNSPNFDIANYDSYVRSLITDAYRLDANYLIFKYSVKNQGIIVDSIWLKKVWEICSPSNRTPVKLQIKQSVVYNIRPAVWYSNKTKFKPFLTRRDFVTALASVVNLKSPPNIQKNWFSNVEKNYLFHTGNTL